VWEFGHKKDKVTLLYAFLGYNNSVVHIFIFDEVCNVYNFSILKKLSMIMLSLMHIPETLTKVGSACGYSQLVELAFLSCKLKYNNEVIDFVQSKDF